MTGAAEPPFLDISRAMLAVKGGPAWTRPAPPRDGCKVTPLIEAADMYPTLEHLVLDAKEAVWLSFRIFDPDTKTRSERCKEMGIGDWGALLDQTVRRGVEVRILLSDFEPVLADYLHAGSWSTYRRIRDIVEKLEKPERERLQLIVIQHEGELGRGWRQLLRFLLRRRIRGVVEKLLKKTHHDDGGFDTRPGLWPWIKWKDDKPQGWRAAPPPRLWPATYHQKFVVVDCEKAIIGGLDLDERRWDDRRHKQRADQTWHDISALIEGPVVADAARHFAFLWNREMPRYRATVDEWTGPCGRELMLDPLTEIGGAIPEQAPRGEAVVQLVRTMSRKSDSMFATGPLHGIRELKAAHREVIRSAQRHLYIEAQFFRSDDAADWVEEALRRNAELEAIILIANTPEEIAFEGQTGNLAHRHGEYLQARALGRLLKRAGPQRVGLFTLAKHEPVKDAEKKFEETRGTAFGSGLIHIHSKLLIADDAVCLLSSANINGRSFEWDTELGFIWKEEEGTAIRAFRERLWAQLFGGCLPEQMNLEGWRDTARFNSSSEPSERRGFVLPYQLGRARRFARPYWFIPDDLV
ncbi:MAG TPA: phospholipase D-like domain-containing protein [Allosphingosinicella sp.]|uniref:phospholipase D family protein n=1 Tax=Allosphingosinicella sp. TaxID=2823234 RepID=UPI002EDA9F33